MTREKAMETFNGLDMEHKKMLAEFVISQSPELMEMFGNCVYDKIKYAL